MTGADGGAGVSNAASITNSGTIQGGSGGGSSVISGNGGAGITSNNLTIINSGTIQGGRGGDGLGSGTAGQGGAGITGNNLTIINCGSIIGGALGSGSVLSGWTDANAITFTAGSNTLTLQGTAWSLTGNLAILTGSLTFNQATAQTLGNIITGWGSVIQNGAGTLTLTGANTYTGATEIVAGALVLAPTASITSNVTNVATFSNFGTVTGTVSNSNTFNNAAGATVTGLVTNSGTSSNAGTLSGGLTNIGGTFNNSGTIAGATTVSGGTLFGTGSVDMLNIANGGTFAPGDGTAGTAMNVAGSLAFASGAVYLVQVTPTTSSFSNVTGAATLGGATVRTSFAPGSYADKQYTIVTAGSVTGTFNPAVANSGLPSAFKTTLSYDSTHAYLNLALDFTTPGTGLSGNQQNVGNALTNFFNNNGSIPIAFGSRAPAALTQLSGEPGSASQQTTFNAMTQFMGIMTDPFIAGRGDPISASGAPDAYADESMAYAAKGAGRSKGERDAYAAVYTKAPPPLPNFEQGWSVWAAGFGGSQRTDGNSTVGSNTTTSNLYGIAVGADYRISPNTIAGFALAGGGTNFSVNNLGSGRSDLFQAGTFIRHHVGAAYLTGTLAYGWQDITTDRTVTVAGLDQLRAEFNANAYSGRVEGGYRFVAPWGGGVAVTPYAAGQFTTFDLPAYAESAVTGTSNFALAYAAKSVTDPRSELGIRTDKSFAMADGILILRGRLAWAHDFNADRSIGTTFQSLPGASFVVNGAAQASDSALATASAEMRWTNGWSAAASFEGEFSNVTRSYAGKGTLRYAW